MVFARIAKAAMGQHCLQAGLKARLGAEIFRGIGFGAAGTLVVVQPGRLHGDGVGRFEIHPILRKRMLDALVHADRAVEHNAFLSITCGATQGVLADAYGLDGDQHAFGVETVQDVAEALACFANQVLIGNEQVVDEHCIGVDRLAAHLGNALDFHPAAINVGIEHADAVGRALAIFQASGARQQHDLAGHLGGRGPHLLAVDEISAIDLLGESLDVRGVEAGVGLGNTETAFILTRHQARHPAPLLLVRAEHHDGMRPEQVDMHGRRSRDAATVADHFMHHERRFGHTQAGATVSFRHGDAEPAGCGHGAVKGMGEFAIVVALQPIIRIKALHDGAHRVRNRALLFGQIKIHENLLRRSETDTRTSSAWWPRGDVRGSLTNRLACV